MPDLCTRAADGAPVSINDAARTAELIAATDTPVARADMDGPFDEKLVISPEAVDLSRIGSGMPLLDSHRTGSLDDVLGTVIGNRFERGRLLMTVRFATTGRGAAMFERVKAGEIRSVSVGYQAVAAADGRHAGTGRRLRTVTKWAVHEVSLVAVPADPNSFVRSQTLPDPAPTPANPAPAPALENRATVNAETRALASVAGFAPAFADALIDRGASLDDVRETIRLAQLANGRPAIRAQVIEEHDTPETFRTGAAEALVCRALPWQKPSDRARPFMNQSTVRLAMDCLRRDGHPLTGLGDAEIVTRALTTTSDFPALLTETGNRLLRTGYEAAPATLKTVARQTTARDFRAKYKLQISEAETLLPIPEGGEYKSSTFTTAKTGYAIASFGRLFGISRPALINDDLSAFSDAGAKMGRAASEFENLYLVNLILDGAGLGPVMEDGLTLFHADHGNFAADAAPPVSAHLSVARLAMRRQKSLAGNPINVRPRFLLVPPELETAAEHLVATIQATKTDDVNPFGGALSVLVEPRLTNPSRWYLIADPAAVEGLEYAYLAGHEGPHTESRVGFEVDGVEFKVRLDFGAAFIDWRGWFMNEGVAG